MFVTGFYSQALCYVQENVPDITGLLQSCVVDKYAPNIKMHVKTEEKMQNCMDGDRKRVRENFHSLLYPNLPCLYGYLILGDKFQIINVKNFEMT